MASKREEDDHVSELRKILSESGIQCERCAPQSTKSPSLDNYHEEFEPEDTDPRYEQHWVEITQYEEAEEGVELKPEESADLFPTRSLRRVIPEKIRGIEQFNRIEVLPEEFQFDVDPFLIPRISITPAQSYIDTLGEMVGCKRYRNNLAEYWLLDTLANLLRRAQDENMETTSQAVLVIWYCEWMKEMQHFDNASRQRMLRRFKENMMAAAKYIAVTDKLPKPKDIGVHYKPTEDETRARVSESDVRRTMSYGETSYDCSLRDLTDIIHYIYDLFSTDFQYNLVRSVFTYSPDYIQLEAPYQMQVPKRLYDVGKKGKGDKTTPKKDAKDAKGKVKPEAESPLLAALLALKAREAAELEALEEVRKEEWKQKSNILPLSFAVEDDFFNKYWPLPPSPEPKGGKK